MSLDLFTNAILIGATLGVIVGALLTIAAAVYIVPRLREGTPGRDRLAGRVAGLLIRLGFYDHVWHEAQEAKAQAESAHS